MNLRLATKNDHDVIRYMAGEFHKESPYSHLPVTYSKVDEVVTTFLSAPRSEKVIFLLLSESAPVGILAAQCNEILFSSAKIAVEQMWWVVKDKRGRGSIELLDGFDYWAKHVAKAQYAQVCTLGDTKLEALSRLYERRGYTLLERCFFKEL